MEQHRRETRTEFDLSQKWLRHLRETAKTSCQVPEQRPELHPQTLASAKSDPHPSKSIAPGLLVLSAKLKKEESSDIKHSDTLTSRPIKKRAIGHGPSPSSSVRTTYCDESLPLPAKGASDNRRGLDDGEPTRPPTTGKRLFEPDSYSPFAAPATRVTNARIPASVLANNSANDIPPQEAPKIVRQPETRPISQEQLVAEVKGIYAGLVMVERKCIQVDAKQAALARGAPAGTQPKLNNEQWQALIALHRTLLHEHHDFFLASQHLSATPAVRRLALKYAMPARLWRHGIHSFLELLRNRLPDSLDHMLAFIYLAYSMMTLLYETVPAFDETWVECLGDLGRYRMAIEDDEIRDREVWTQVARQWYLKASSRSPEIRRLYHHLAILARPNALQQLFYNYEALSVPQPFTAARESILILFQPLIEEKQARRLPIVITAYIKLHDILFARNSEESFDAAFVELSSHLDSHIERVTQRYLEQGYYITISNILALLGNSHPNAILIKALSQADASNISIDGDLPVPDKNNCCPTLEDFALRDLFWTARYFIPGWLRNKNIEDENQDKEGASINTNYRPERIIWLGCQLAKSDKWIWCHDYSPIEGEAHPVPDKSSTRPSPPYETVSDCEEPWIDCLDDLERDRIGIEDDVIRDREVWPQENLKKGSYFALASLWKLSSISIKGTPRYFRSLNRTLNHLKTNLLLLVYMMFIRGLMAMPTGSLPGTNGDEIGHAFTQFWKTKLQLFVDETAAPLLYNACISFVLIVVYMIIVQLHNGRWKGRSLLLIVKIAISLGFFYLTMGEHLSGWQMVIGWVFVASFHEAYIREKLANLQLSGIHAVTIVAPGILGAALVATYAEIDGKWSDRWTLAAVAVLPCTMTSTCIWVAFLHETTIIHSIDNGTYLAPALDVLRDIWAHVRIWHGMHLLNTLRASPDLVTQAPRANDETVKSLSTESDTVQPVDVNIAKTVNRPKRERQRRYRPQHQRVRARPAPLDSAPHEGAVAGKNKFS